MSPNNPVSDHTARVWIPFLCPYGHELGPGRVIVSWTPCQCPAALDHYRGHYTVQCRACLDAKEWASISYWPPHLGDGHPQRFDDAQDLAIRTGVSHAGGMRIVEEPRADALFVSFADHRKPARTEVLDGGGMVVDVDADGRLLDLMVLAPQRDWTAPLEQVLGVHEVAEPDAERLRVAARPVQG